MTIDSIYQHPLLADIERLKKERNAVILAHYYQESEIQDIADYLGDSLQLAQAAQKTDADVILFCGVHFMAETAKILNPERIVILPDLRAGCSLADSCPPDKLAAFKEAHPEHIVISYINCSAAVKALSDMICTSSNAEKVIANIPEDKPIIFAPDKHLGRYLQRKTGRDMLLWNGSCMVHELFSEKEIVKMKSLYKAAKLLAHPECEENILRHADHIGSTTSIIQEVVNGPDMMYIVATEAGVLHEMKRLAPHKEVFPAPSQNNCGCNVCPHMRRNTLEKVHAALLNLEPQIHLDKEIQLRALKPLERMLEISAR